MILIKDVDKMLATALRLLIGCLMTADGMPSDGPYPFDISLVWPNSKSAASAFGSLTTLHG